MATQASGLKGIRVACRNVPWLLLLLAKDLCVCVYESYAAVTEDELKRRTGEFDLEAISFLDLSDQGKYTLYHKATIIFRY